MALRCRPGDIARIAYPEKAFEDLRDKFVKVVEIQPTPENAEVWLLAEPIPFILACDVISRHGELHKKGWCADALSIADNWLVPLRGFDLSEVDSKYFELTV